MNVNCLTVLQVLVLLLILYNLIHMELAAIKLKKQDRYNKELLCLFVKEVKEDTHDTSN